MAGVLTRPLPTHSKQKPTIRPFPLLANRDPSFPTRRAQHVTVFAPYQATSSPTPGSLSSLLRSQSVRVTEQCHCYSHLHTRNGEPYNTRLQPKSILVCAHMRVPAYQSRAAPRKPSNPTRPNEPPVAPAPFLVGWFTGAALLSDDCVPVPELAVLATPAAWTPVGIPVC